MSSDETNRILDRLDTMDDKFDARFSSFADRMKDVEAESKLNTDFRETVVKALVGLGWLVLVAIGSLTYAVLQKVGIINLSK